MRFEAPVGKPIRYKSLVFIVRACETTAADEGFQDLADRLTRLSPKGMPEDRLAKMGEAFLDHALENPRRYTINGGEYLLIELPDYALPPTLEETFYSLRLAGMTPILTHPERNPTLQRDDSRLKNWIRDGMLTQVTAASVMGLMGRTAQKMAERMLADRWVHFIATDAHNISTRPPKMRDALDHIAGRYGEQYAQRLCTENPQAAFDSRHLPQQEAPQKIFDSADEELFDHEEEKPRGLLRRIFRRCCGRQKAQTRPYTSHR